MDRTRWERIQALFHAAVEYPPDEWEAFLRTEADGEPELVTEVLALLQEDAGGNLPLANELPRIADDLLAGGGVSPLLQDELGPYRIRRAIGEGGTGTVYLAERSDIGALVAIKVLRDAWLSPARRERFAAEQRTLAQLNHPFIAQIHDAGSLADGTPWFVMEYVDGVPVTEYCRAHGTSIEGRLELFRAVCTAVQHAHGHAVIHRDLKPSNILVKPDGTIKLVDFGIAKHLASLDATIDQTRTGLRLMTPAYAAPEQIRGDRVGIRTDVYSLGVVLYELLAGRLPFDLSNQTPAEAISTIATVEPERLSAVVRRRASGEGPTPRSAGRISWSDLDVLCQVAMHKDPLRRYQTVEGLIRDVDRYLAGEPLEARPDRFGYRFGKFVRRNRVSVLAATLTLVTLVALVAFYTVRLARARNDAVAEATRTQRIQKFMLNLFEGGEESVAPADGLSVLTLVDRGVQEARSLTAEPALQAELYATLGGIYHQLGDLARADTLLREALQQRRKLHGNQHPDVAASLVSLGLLRSAEANYDEAEKLVREGLDLTRRKRPADHPAVAEATAAFGHVLVERGDYAAAIDALEEAVRLYSAQGVDTPELATTLHELSNAHFYGGDLATADSISRRVLSISRSLYGDRHPHVAEDLVNLGAIQHEQGRYDQAERYYRQALEITRAWHGEDHYQTASTLTMLGRTLVHLDRDDEASDLLRHALAIQERVFGSDHPRVASAINDLGTLAMRRGDYDAADRAFRRMAEIYRTIYPDGHYLVGIAVSNLGSVYHRRERYAEAERCYRDALAIFEKTLSPDHVNSGIARIKLGRTLLRQGRYDEAESESLGGFRILADRTEPSVSWMESAREDLFEIYTALGRKDEAEALRAEIAAQSR